MTYHWNIIKFGDLTAYLRDFDAQGYHVISISVMGFLFKKILLVYGKPLVTYK